MLISGWRTRQFIEGTGTFECPVCRLGRGFANISSQKWFTIFFIPLFPLGAKTYYISCGTCQTVFDPNQMGAANSQLTQALYSSTAASVPQARSALALTSVIMGVMSPFFMLFCFPSLITSLVAIVTGHMAKSKIKASEGRVSGDGMATAGLLTGYGSFALTLMLIAGYVYFVKLNPTPGVATRVTANAATSRLDRAESAAEADKENIHGDGNSQQAIQVARDFASTMQLMYAAAAAESDVSISSTDKFGAYCELQPGSCVLIVHVPRYRKLAKADKQALAEIAWTVANRTVEGNLKPGDRLAVGLRGSILYGAVMIGKHTAEDAETEYVMGDKDDLTTFFERPRVEKVQGSTEPNIPAAEEAKVDAPEATPGEVNQPSS